MVGCHATGGGGGGGGGLVIFSVLEFRYLESIRTLQGSFSRVTTGSV